MTFDLESAAWKFANQINDLLVRVLPLDSLAEMPISAVHAKRHILVHPGEEQQPKLIPLFYRREHRAYLFLSYKLTHDSERKFSAVQESKFELTPASGGAPLLRLDFLKDARQVPCAHWNVHAEREELAPLLKQRPSRKKGKPLDISRVHLPVGGTRHRPCLEDFLQMLFEDFNFDGNIGKELALAEGREMWRRTQIRALVRDSPEDAMEILAGLGYEISPPSSEVRESKNSNLQRY
ncbi:hypothetical protein [Saccharopolyspora halophila]|uniref:hypothetical protein n=1 Tax=Saccharopolyspora halophila TaxID=405551 RepID=UPI0031DC688F